MSARSAGKWNASIGTFAAWAFSACGFWALTFALEGIKSTWALTEAQVGALVSSALAARFIGAIASGSAAEAYGRKIPFVISIVVCGFFGFLGSTAASYNVLLLYRALFGVGLGGVWVAGMALALQPLQGNERGIASGLLQGGWNWGYVLAAIADAIIASVLGRRIDSWRAMLRLGGLPLLVAPWIAVFVHDRSAQKEFAHFASAETKTKKLAVLQIFSWGLIATTVHTSFIMGCLMAVYYSLTAFYPRFLGTRGLRPLWFVVLLNAGGIAGELVVGRLSSSRIGRRGAVTVAALVSLLSIPCYLHIGTLAGRALGALFMGAAGLGMWGVVPRYLADRFPDRLRAIGPGFAYHAGALMASPTPLLIGWIVDKGIRLDVAMSAAIALTCLSAVLVFWVGPESWSEVRSSMVE